MPELPEVETVVRDLRPLLAGRTITGVRQSKQKPAGKPYGDKGFLVFRKAGDGAILLPKQFNNTNIIGNMTNALQ